MYVSVSKKEVKEFDAVLRQLRQFLDLRVSDRTHVRQADLNWTALTSDTTMAQTKLPLCFVYKKNSD